MILMMTYAALCSIDMECSHASAALPKKQFYL